jgi:DNA repair protein RadA/Sms
MRIQEPAADVAAAAALVSSLCDAPLPPQAVYFGEVSLSGAIRPVAQAASRLKEAAKLGFTGAVVPESGRGETGDPGLKSQEIGSLATLVAEIAANGRRKPAKSGGQDG